MCSSAQYNTLNRLPDHAWPKDQDIAATPWADIRDNPSDYYDTNKFALPLLLQSPDHMSPTDVLKVAEYLASHSFLFYPKADILDKRRTRKAEEEAQDDDEEDVDPSANLDEEEVVSDSGMGNDAKPDEEEVEEVTEHGKGAEMQPPPRRTSRTKHSSPDNIADADAPVRRGKRLKKESFKRKATTAEGSGAGKKVCSMPLTVIVPPS
jgi:hypothetical protein